MSTPVILVFLLAVPALIGQGPAMRELRTGFTTFLATPAALPAFVIGVLYEGLFIFTTLIFLDRREYSFGIPVHVCASLLAGVAASMGLSAIFGSAPPSGAQFVAAGCVILAALALSYPTIRALLISRRPVAARNLLFVCGGNTCRSPMAVAIAVAQVAEATTKGLLRVSSAGTRVETVGSPMTPEAVAALHELGVDAPAHHSRELTLETCLNSDVIYCMTTAQRDTVIAMDPELAGRTLCLDQDGDILDPIGKPVETYLQCAKQIAASVRVRLAEQPERYALAMKVA